jgi:hypothetical protein
MTATYRLPKITVITAEGTERRPDFGNAGYDSWAAICDSDDEYLVQLSAAPAEHAKLAPYRLSTQLAIQGAASIITNQPGGKR